MRLIHVNSIHSSEQIHCENLFVCSIATKGIMLSFLNPPIMVCWPELDHKGKGQHLTGLQHVLFKMSQRYLLLFGDSD